LARPVRPAQPDDLARPDPERDLARGLERAVALPETVDDQDRLGLHARGMITVQIDCNSAAPGGCRVMVGRAPTPACLLGRGGSTWVAATILGTASAGLSCGTDDPEQVLEGLLTEYSERERSGEPAASLAALESRIDALAGQKDAVFSGLYWHRDLEQAKQA